MALTKITGQVVDTTTDLVVGVTTVGGGLSATDGFFSGIVTAVGDASFSGSVSVGGTLTYEDVTNIDAVGLVTARNGIVVGSGITLSKDGDIFAVGVSTFTGAIDANGNVDIAGGLDAHGNVNLGDASSDTITAVGGFDSNLVPSTDSDHDLGLTGTRWRNAYVDTYYGDGSNLTGITGTTINNNANNRVITGSGTANTLEGESSLTYDGNGTFNITGTGASGVFVITPDTVDGGIYFNDGSSNKGALTYLHTDETMNFRVNGTNKLTINSSGNLVLGVSGAGIDFSATADASGSGASNQAEILNDYEQGDLEFTVTGANGGSISYSYRTGHYTRIGNVCHVSGDIRFDGSWSGSDGEAYISLPFTSEATGGCVGGGVVSEWNLNSSAYVGLMIQVENNASIARVTAHDGSNNNTSSFQTDYLGSGRYLKFAFTYQCQ